jgi:phosphatidylserine synthase
MRRIPIFPTLVTLGNLVSGFAAIGMASKAQLLWKEAEWADAGKIAELQAGAR